VSYVKELIAKSILNVQGIESNIRSMDLGIESIIQQYIKPFIEEQTTEKVLKEQALVT